MSFNLFMTQLLICKQMMCHTILVLSARCQHISSVLFCFVLFSKRLSYYMYVSRAKGQTICGFGIPDFLNSSAKLLYVESNYRKIVEHNLGGQMNVAKNRKNEILLFVTQCRFLFSFSFSPLV